MDHSWVHEFRAGVVYSAGGVVHADEAEDKDEVARALTRHLHVTISFNDSDSTMAAQPVRPIRRLSPEVSDRPRLRGRAPLRRHR